MLQSRFPRTEILLQNRRKNIVSGPLTKNHGENPHNFFAKLLPKDRN